jgi:hypothetical protein
VYCKYLRARARLVHERPAKLCVDIVDSAFPRFTFAYLARLCEASAEKPVR